MPIPPRWAHLFTGHTTAQVGDGSVGYFEGSVTGPTGVYGSEVWLFAVPDARAASDGALMLSCEVAQVLYMGALDLSTLALETGDVSVLEDVTWTPIETDSGAISDHWHIWAHGYHWIAFQDVDALEVRLFKIAIDEVSGTSAVTPSSGTALIFSGSNPDAMHYETSGISTNDLFLVKVPDGVAVGIWRNDRSSVLVVTVDTSLVRVRSRVRGGRERLRGHGGYGIRAAGRGSGDEVSCLGGDGTGPERRCRQLEHHAGDDHG